MSFGIMRVGEHRSSSGSVGTNRRVCSIAGSQAPPWRLCSSGLGVDTLLLAGPPGKPGAGYLTQTST